MDTTGSSTLNAARRSHETMLQQMNNAASMGRAEKSDRTNEMDAMDDLQFDASLDALLDSENLGDTTAVQDSTSANSRESLESQPSGLSFHHTMAGPTTTTHSSTVGNNAPASGPHSTSYPTQQGLLTGGQTRSHVFAMHNFPYAATDGKSSLPGRAISSGPVGVAAGPTPYASAYQPPNLVQTPSGISLTFPQHGQHQQQHILPQGHLAQTQRMYQDSQQSQHAFKPIHSPPTTNDSSDVKSTSSVASASSTRKRTLDISEVSEDEDEKGRRRHDRNLREQQRSHKITQRIAELRDVLAAANVKFKSDKYSTLVKVAEYIKQLQTRSTMLDEEHKKLIETISKTNEIVNNQYMPASTTGEELSGIVKSSPDCTLSEEDSMVFVRGIDYKSVFARCGVALAVASIDGRLMDCNKEFEKLTSFARDELLPCEQQLPGEHFTSHEFDKTSSSSTAEAAGVVADAVPSSTTPTPTSTANNVTNAATRRNLSLFNLLCREDMEDLFRAMSEMLIQPSCSMEIEPVQSAESTEAPAAPPNIDSKDYWTGIVRLSRMRDVNMRMNVALVRSPKGRARFFDCSFYPVAASTQS